MLVHEDLKGAQTPLKPKNSNDMINAESNKLNAFKVKQTRDVCIMEFDSSHSPLNQKCLSELREVTKPYKGYGFNRYASTYCRISFPAHVRSELVPLINAILADKSNRESKQ